MIKSNGYIMLQLHFLLFSKITLEKSSYVSWYHSWLRRKHKVDDIMLCIFTRPIYPNIHMHGKGHYFSCSYANKTRRRHNRKLLTKYAFPKKGTLNQILSHHNKSFISIWHTRISGRIVHTCKKCEYSYFNKYNGVLYLVMLESFCKITRMSL